MSFPFSAVGFADLHELGLDTCLEQAFAHGQSYACEAGTLLCWRLEGEAELWFQVDENNNCIGVNPDFNGKSQEPVEIQKLYPKTLSSPFDGAFYCQYTAPENNPKEDYIDCAFVCDVTEFSRLATMPLPVKKHIRRTGFAEHIFIMENTQELESYIQAPHTAPPDLYKIAERSFFPMCAKAFGDPEQEQDPDFPPAITIMSGVVQDAAEKENPYTGLKFYWALVDTATGTVDVVMNPELVTRPLKPGCILQASIWLTGRLIQQNELIKYKINY